MTTHDKDSHAPVSRRDFLALATGGAALAATGWPGKTAPGIPAPQAPAAGATSLDTGGIALEHFEAAQKRAAAMVAKMTLAEKISQFGARSPAIPRLNIRAFNYYASEALHGLIHDGPVTSFPLPLAMGCSWNRALIQRVFTAASDEIWAWHKKNGQGLAMFSPPTVNMGTRDPRWGRIGENYSEDPYLVGQMAIYTIHGMQGDNTQYLKTVACAKHFIANDTEVDRHSTSATVDPRNFWEYYSRGFRTCVEQGHVFTVMSSYNAMNGIPTTANRSLLTDLLRDRWGLRGYVVSDCGAVADIYRSHHFVANYAEAAALAVNAGCDINCGRILQQYLGQAVDESLVGEATLNESLTRSFTGRVLLGEFDPPEQIPYDQIPISCLESSAHQELAREAAQESIVLFKNENATLPLDKGRLKKIAVIGPMADTCHLGNYSGTPWVRVSPLQGIQRALGIAAGASYEKRASDFSSLGTNAARGPFGVPRGPQLASSSEGGQVVGFPTNSWAAYDHMLFTGATELHARVAGGVARGPGGAAGGPGSNQSRSAPSGSVGTIEFHLDSLTGPVISTLHIPNTGGTGNWVNVSAPVNATEGEHSVYLTVRSGAASRISLQSFTLTPARPSAPAAQGTAEVLYAMGCTVTGEKNETQFAEAVTAAKGADVALVFVGADQQVDREGHDRDYLRLPGVQHELVQAVYAANPRTILVISSNCPVAATWEQDTLPAVVGGMFLGEQQGNALADVLFGDYNPGGKVSTTWYRGTEDLPEFHDYNIRRGRTYMYFQGDPLYPFGHGLSYTTFAYKNLRLSSKTLGPGGKVNISLDVTNSGKQDGDEIVQAYVHVTAGGVVRPIKQLVNFDRIHLKTGETQTVNFELSHDDLALRYWDEARYEFVAAPGTVDVMIGASSADIRLKGQLQLSA